MKFLEPVRQVFAGNFSQTLDSYRFMERIKNFFALSQARRTNLHNFCHSFSQSSKKFSSVVLKLVIPSTQGMGLVGKVDESKFRKVSLWFVTSKVSFLFCAEGWNQQQKYNMD